VLKLVNLYRKRIKETYKCSTCDKKISEKHPYKHPNSIVRLGEADGYPDGVPMDIPRDEIEWKNKLYCYPCWKKRFVKK
jgi:DNA-directed RNA polymerase subunit RPC12/RpoP